MRETERQVLARIRQALSTAPSPATERVGSPPRPWRDRPPLEDLVAAFRREAAAVGASVHGPLSATAALAQTVRLAGPERAVILAWDEDAIGLRGLHGALADAGHTLLDSRATGDARPDPELARLATATIGLTGALAGLADTGSVVLACGPGRPRLAWLLPPVHVAVLRCDALVADLEACLARSPQAVQGSANLCIVTGPSRTGDIELILTQGVHGPGRVEVVLVEG